MKRVLILTYYWPPSGGAGVQRWLKFVKYLREFDWEPIVYTAKNGEMPETDTSLEKDIPSGTEVIKTPIWEPYSAYKTLIGQKKDEKINAAFLNESKKKSLFSKLAVWIRGNLFIPDARKFWIRPSVNYLKKYLDQHPVDVIISSGPPHSMHLIALGLKRNFPQIKWVADFRDPWTNIDFYKDLMLSRWADKKHRLLEYQVLRESDAVISVGKTISEELFELSGGNEKEKFHTITNGFDVDDLLKPNNIQKDQKFSIAHIGTLVKTRNPEILWNALKELISEHQAFKNDFEIKLVGKVDITVMESLEKFKLKDYVRKINYLPHNEVIAEQQRSHVNLLLINNTPNAKGILTGKFFEYLSAGTPILAIGPVEGDAAHILNETKAGKIFDFTDKQGIKNALLNLYNHKQPQPEMSAIMAYSRKNLTGKLAYILNQLAEN
jgi:glycosyltransferase involved in cell wall biosynthesis